MKVWMLTNPNCIHRYSLCTYRTVYQSNAILWSWVDWGKYKQHLKNNFIPKEEDFIQNLKETWCSVADTNKGAEKIKLESFWLRNTLSLGSFAPMPCPSINRSLVNTRSNCTNGIERRRRRSHINWLSDLNACVRGNPMRHVPTYTDVRSLRPIRGIPMVWVWIGSWKHKWATVTWRTNIYLKNEYPCILLIWKENIRGCTVSKVYCTSASDIFSLFREKNHKQIHLCFLFD